MGVDMTVQSDRKIYIHFHPRADGSPWCVEKDEGGRKRRYLEGVTSGLIEDGHGERMTDNAIKSFQTQAERGDVLLYAGNHGSAYHEDIGLLVESGVEPGGDWFTRYRLYDEADGMGSHTLEAADKIWRQINGLPPYTTPQERGFSIEGDIPEGGLKFVDKDGRRVMDEIALDGVWLVRKPSYRSSIAHAVAKAIGVPIPGKVRRSLARSLRESMQESEARSAYYDATYRLQSAVDDEVKRIVCSGAPDMGEQLDALFGEFGSMATQLILENKNVFEDDGESGDADDPIGLYASDDEGQELSTRLAIVHDQLAQLVSNLRARN